MEKILAAAGCEETGNTSKSPRISASRNWVFTLNNYDPEKIDELYNDLAAKAKSFVFGLEVGENGTPHLQGQITFKKCERPLEFYRKWNAHWEKQKGTNVEATDYCKKDGNYYQYPKPKVLNSLIKTLRPWQHELAYRCLYEPINDREIIWVVDPIGNSGKSAFCKYMYFWYKCIYVTVAKSADIAMCATEDAEVYLFDFSRTMVDFCPWMAIENLKNGFIQDGKLKKEMKTICVDPPIVICFSNFEPDVNKLSMDRWNIIHLPL